MPATLAAPGDGENHGWHRLRRKGKLASMNEADLQSPWPSQSEPVHVTKYGLELIRDPLLNKGTAFTRGRAQSLPAERAAALAADLRWICR